MTVARGKAATVDHDAVDFAWIRLAVELDGAARFDDPMVQLRKHAARLDMAFTREKKRLAETPVERRFEFGQRRRVEPPMARRQPREALEVVAVAAVRHHQRAVEWRVRQLAPPQIERAQAEPADHRFGRLALAVWREHAARPVAGRENHSFVAALMQR